MGLYDQVQQTNTPFMSNFVGAPVPELNQYSQLVQNRYNEAANSDDALSEAMGNLSHLGLDADTQYANELKDQYYKRVQDRADSGDFENMGRRTRQDAIRFSQAYQPLLQRQKDMTEIVKNIQGDDHIADPATKQALIQKAMFENTPQKDPTTGDYIRDQNGRIQLGGIRNSVYAPDADVQKTIDDALAHKKADIVAGRPVYDRQGNLIKMNKTPVYDGHGNITSYTSSVLTKNQMADMAQQVIQTDPKIKAMLARDAELKTYNMTPDQVHQALVDRKLDQSSYQNLKGQGLNSAQIQSHLQAMYPAGQTQNGMISPLDAAKAKYKQDGFSDASAEKAILNSKLQSEAASSYTGLAGDLFSVSELHPENMIDHYGMQDRQHNLDKVDAGNFQLINATQQRALPLNPEKLTTDYSNNTKTLEGVRTNLNGEIIYTLGKLGLSTGNATKDQALATEYANDPAKMSQLTAKMTAINPTYAARLQTSQQGYLNSKDELDNQAAKVQNTEQASGINLDKMYQDYKNGTDKPKSKADFIDALHNHESGIRGFIAGEKSSLAYESGLSIYGETVKPAIFGEANKLYAAASDYDEKMKKGASIMSGGNGTKDNQAAYTNYSTIEPQNSKYADELTTTLSNAIKEGRIPLKAIGIGDNTSKVLADHLGLNKKNLADDNGDDYKKMKATTIRLNSNWPGGKPSITATTGDGVQTQYQIDDPNMVGALKEAQVRLIGEATANKTSDQAKNQARTMSIGLGESAAKIDANELHNYAPSSVHYHLTPKLDVQVLPDNKYNLYLKGTNTKIGSVNSIDDLYLNLGADEYNNIKSQRK